MDNFIIYDKNKYLLCEYMAYYNLHPSYTIKGKRISPYFIYSEQYGYIKAFDELSMKPILIEQNAWDSFLFTIKIIDENGAHVQCDAHKNAPYLYTIPYNSKCTIIAKKDNYYQLQGGGWLNRFIYQIYPTKIKKKVFMMNKYFKPLLVIINNVNNSTILFPRKQTIEHLKYKTIHSIFKKGFIDNRFAVKTIYGYIPYEDVSIIGYFNLDDIRTLDSNYPICIICMLNPINTTTIHGDFSHSFCCYDCSKMLHTKTCPVCRLPIEKIILNYTISVANTPS